MFLFGTSFVHRNGSAPELLTVQGSDSCPALCVVAHSHKREAARPASLSIIYDSGLFYSAKLFEDVLKISFGRFERQVSNIKLHSLINLIN